jgi:hypothetical protein
MRKKWTIEQLVRGQNLRAKRLGAPHDLTIDQWMETLAYFNYKCAYCGIKEYDFIEHYLTIGIKGTTISNCVPACAGCNVMKDNKNHSLTLYQSRRVLEFLESKGVNIEFHIHEYKASKQEHVVLSCESCGINIDVPGLAIEEAKDYIDRFFQNTGYAYQASL